MFNITSHGHYRAGAYVADCDSRGFLMLILTNILKSSVSLLENKKSHVAYFYDGFPVLWVTF